MQRLGLYLRFSFITSTSINIRFPQHDCGSSIQYKDGNGISWVGDDKYVQSGESHSVKPNNSISHVADTLRVFTTRKKNCYYIDSVKQGRVLVRDSFYYGNYDGKSFPPEFALQFDGNAWDQVHMTNTSYYYYEVTYLMKKDSISVCLAQTESDQFPFITALEIRSLEPKMYHHIDDSYPLFVWVRPAFGSNITIRYPEDPYDRLWAPGLFKNGSIPVSSDAVFSDLTSLYDRPPAAVLKNAITATSPNASIELVMQFPSYKIPVYINWFFSEVTRLGPTQNQSFQIFKDNKSYSEPISPPYGDCIQMLVSNVTVSSNTIFSLVPTNVSTLPPLINALEIFSVGESPLADGTNKKDVEGLASLQDSFSVLHGWTGNPCLPGSDYTWDCILCNYDNPTPRVTALLLGSYSLSGLLPDFSSMIALQTIDLHNNSLRGPIPNFLGTLPSLKTLNLARNQFSGTVPTSLTTKKGLNLMNFGRNQFSGIVPASLTTKKGLNLMISGNLGLWLCTSSSTTASCQIPATPATSPPPSNGFVTFTIKPSKDVNLIAWVGDENYVNTGESHSVKPDNSLSHVADTLRVFTTGKKNCYHIDSVLQGRVLLRASFYYGNYDGKSSPPTFALYFDGNDWAQVQTSNTQLIYYEVTYTMKKDSISVCVAQTKPEQFPFITALEVRSLESVMYSRVHESLPLFLWRRVAFGSNATIRYQDDPYDRLWAIRGLSNGSRLVSSDALFGERKLSIDRPPPAVLKHAMVAVSPNTSLELLMGFPNYNISAYMNFYFSEVTRLGPNQTRSFSVFMNNEPLSISFSPPYDTYIEYWVTNIAISLNTTFSLVSTNVSTLPPLINALEIFRVGDHQLTDGTNNNDVEGLAALQKSFSVLKSLSGDPCLPASYTWDWIQCNNDPSPRVTALLLGGYNLSGLLPDFSSMDALETIDLHNSSLRGPIPNFLGTLPNLRTLNLAKNQLSGTVPVSLSTKMGLNLTVSGNPDLCTSNTTLKSCQILTAPSPVNSSIKKKSNILELLFAGVIPSLIML